MKRFDITYFHGPFEEYMSKPEVLDDIVAAGITLVPLACSTEVNRKVLPMLKERGVDVNLHDARLYDLYIKEDSSAVDAVVKSVVEDYADLADCFIGWDIVDEPSTVKFPILGEIVAALRRYSPGKETTINLFPSYAVPGQLVAPSYESYLEQFIDLVKPDFISYDHYHFLGRYVRDEEVLRDEGKLRERMNALADSLGISDDVDERERLIRMAAETVEDRAGFFTNIEQVRAAALRHNLPAMLIVLLTEHGPYRNLTRAELLWENNMCLCYGFKRLSYFTYWEPAHDDFWRWMNAMCDTVGEKQPHYYDAQAINAELFPIGERLFTLDSVGVWHLGELEPGCRDISECVSLPKLVGENGVVGEFSDGSFYLVNRDFENANRFVVASEKLRRFDAASREFVPCSGEITLGAGEACLLIEG